MSGSSEVEDYLSSIISQYTDDGDPDAALEAARAIVFDLMTRTDSGVPTVVVLEALEVWIAWTMRIVGGMLATVIVDTHESWNDERGDEFVTNFLIVMSLLKEHAMRSIIEARMPETTLPKDNDEDTPTADG